MEVFNMRKILFRSFVVMMVLLLLSTTAFAAPSPRFGLDSFSDVSYEAIGDASPVLTANLYAGQNTYVGEVRVEPLAEEDTFRVTYFIPVDLDYYFSEIHFEGISVGELQYISNSGGLIPGKFTVKMSVEPAKLISFTYEGTMPIEFFAAHAVVFLSDVDQEETAWAGCSESESEFSNWSSMFPAD